MKNAETVIKFPFKAITGYDTGKDVIIVYRNNSGEKTYRRYRNYPWYFAVEKKHEEKVRKLSALPELKIEEEENYFRVYCPKDWDHKEFRQELRQKLEENGIKPLEFDLSLLKRFCIDNDIKVEENLKIGFIDIETDDTLNSIEIGRDRIISYAICDKEGKTKFNYNKNEHKLLEELVEDIRDFDVLCGWNSESFDFPYIKIRCSMYGITVDWRKFVLFDLMKRLIKLFGPMMTTVGLTGFSLEEVSQTFLSRGKIERNEKVSWMEKNDLKKLEEYNINDVLLLHELDKKLLLFDLMIKECVWTGTFLNRFYVGELLDNYILREAKKQGKHLASQREYSKDRIPVQGAFVMEPVAGMHKNVRVFDFKSMYPSIIVSFNISHDTLLDEPEENCITTPNEQYFSKRKGIYSDLIKYLLEMRKSYKKQQIESEYGSIEYNNSKAMQEVVKELSNSMYGITADPNSRFFDKRIAESITLGGQHLLSKSKEFIEEIGYKVLYQDTDSLFVAIEEKEKIEEILKEVNRKLKEHLTKTFNLSEYIIELQYEKTFDPLVLVEKKRYTGLMTDLDGKPVNKIFTRGLEVIKKDTIEYTRKKLNEALTLILVEKKGLPFFSVWVSEMKKEVFSRNFTADELKITKKVSRPISDYRTKLPHVRLAEQLVKEGKILETQSGKHVWGQKIEFIVTNYGRNYDGDNHPHHQMNEILASDFDGVWDKTYYWNVQIFGVMKRFLSTVFPDYGWDSFIEKKSVKREQPVNPNQLKMF